MNYLVVNQTDQRIPRKFVEWWMEESFKVLKRVRGLRHKERLGGELVLVFLPLKEAKKLNQEFRGKNKATDVLSFDALEPGGLGELIFSPSVIAEQARQNRWAWRYEWAYLCLHGVLHLLSYDHEQDEAEAKEMFELQDRTFDKLMRLWQTRSH